MPSLPATSAQRGHRGDIDGLRAIAVLAVVGFHAGVPGMGGGFVGVDVFFVISGFLITSIILNELASSDALALVRFWARRARRLLPALAAVTVFTLLASQLIESPLAWSRTVSDAFAATFYWANEHFARARTDYFAPELSSSPFLHTWSLAVEEQFYVLWPLLLLAVHRAVRPALRAPAMFVTVAGLATWSFVATLDGGGQKGHFFSSATRFWELAIGGLLAIGGVSTKVEGKTRLRTVLGATSTAWLVLSVVLVNDRMQIPGVVSLLPVLATAGLLVAGAGSGWAGNGLFALPMLQAVGRISYAWYLWHWPTILLGSTLLGYETTSVKVTLAGLSVIPAALTHRLVENPIRFNRRLVASARKSLAVGAACVFVAAISAVVADVRTDRTLDHPVVSMANAARADSAGVSIRCASLDVDVLLEVCTTGDVSADPTVMLVGDSHAGHWTPALDRAGLERGFRVIASVQGSCTALGPPSTVDIPGCGVRRQQLRQLVQEVQPDLVIVTHSLAYIGTLEIPGGSRSIDAQLNAWQAAHASFAAWLRDERVPLVVILDNPRFREDPNECVARERSFQLCRSPRRDVLSRVAGPHASERVALAAAAHGLAFDPVPMLCPSDPCPLLSSGQPMYQDEGHLTRTYSRALWRELATVVDAGLSASQGEMP